MKLSIKILFVAFILAGFAACNKVDDLPLYQKGEAGVLTVSATSIAPVVADSNSTALMLSWTRPSYGIDSNAIRYVVEIDSSGKDFVAPFRKTLTGATGTSFLAKELNAILLNFGFEYDKAYDVDVRVISSYANNNNRLVYNTAKLNIKTYKVPPKVVPPASKTLFLVGNATAGGWDNPVPGAAQKFTSIDSVTYEGTFYLNGGREFLVLPVNGSWDHKYSIADNTQPGANTGGSFGLDLKDNIPSPPKTGLYKITIDFQRGIYTITPVKIFGLLYVPGDYQGWNPASAPALGSPNDDGNYEAYINIPAGNSLKFKLASQPDWNGTNYGDGGNGTLSTSGADMGVPEAGYYKMNANTTDNTWSAEKTTWGMIGDFNGWGGDAAMVFNSDANAWIGTITAATDGFFKFRANGGWSLNYGTNLADGSLKKDGDNIAITSGTHEVRLYLGNAGYYTFSIK